MHVRFNLSKQQLHLEKPRVTAQSRIVEGSVVWPKLSRSALLGLLMLISAIAVLVQGGICARAGIAIMSGATLAQAAATTEQAGTPLAQMLEPDDTLDLSKGFSGSLDPSGYRLETDSGGVPHFLPVSAPTNNPTAIQPAAPQVAGDENWDDRFGDPGAVTGLAFANGILYIATADTIYTWNGIRLTKIGTTDAAAFTFATQGGGLYIGGAFTNISGVSASHVAQWNGSAWSAMGSGVNDNVYTIAVGGGSVYIGGRFTGSGGLAVPHIARWDGGGWSTIDNGTDGYNVPRCQDHDPGKIRWIAAAE